MSQILFTERSHPFVASDVIVVHKGDLLLIERRHDPQGYAIPGGYIEYGESAELAALRELEEETQVQLQESDLHQFGFFSDPKRDARAHSITLTFWAEIPSESARPMTRGGDDALRADWYAIHRLPSPMAFDHAKVLEKFIEFRKKSF